eukprot:gene1270-924_t
MLNAMTAHIDRTDVQEAGCDLLWSLAFNSSIVKELIAKCNGAVVLVRALKRHTRSPDFLKSACGALSNICQFKQNQEAVAAQGGLQPLVGSIHIHQTNAKLLPFIFDAIASIIVNNEDNAKTVSSLGIIPVGVATLSRHKQSREVVKSGCHTLAILSDVKGQASKIAFAGGVPVILSLLDLHPLYSDLHRVAAVVLLRMLQESSQVGREICSHEGVRILLYSLEKGGAQQDTVAAVTHILYSITNPNSPAASTIESQLWSRSATDLPSTSAKADAGDANARQTALVGVVTILGQYAQRRDVVRAACRLVTNLSHYSNVIQALDNHNVLEKVLDCISVHRDTKDVLEAASVILKNVGRWRKPKLRSPGTNTIQGFLHLFESRLSDEEVVTACGEICKGMLEDELRVQPTLNKTGPDDQEPWYLRAVSTCLIALNMYGSSMSKLNEEKMAGKTPGSTTTEHARVINSVAEFLLLCMSTDNLSFEDSRFEEVMSFLQNWNQGNGPDRMSMLLYLEEKLRKRTTTGTKAPATDGDAHAGAIDRQGSKLASTAELEGKVDGEDSHAMGRNGHASRSMSRVTSQTNVGQSTAGGTNMSRSASQDRHHSRYNAMQDRDVPNRMHLSYESLKPGGKSIISRCPTPIPYHVPTGGLGPAFGHSLTFDSEFESGNLFRAIQVGDATYDLLLRADVHTQGHTQWFYFAVSNTHPPELVRLAEQGVQVPPVRVCFNLINFTKPDSLFNLGMRPVVYSAVDARTRGTGWVRAGSDISYYGNNFVRNNNSGEGSASYFTLTFTLEFHHPKDTVLIAYSYPYTLNDYRHHVQQIVDRPRSEQMIRKFKLCSTLSGEDCDLVVITDFSDGREKIGPLTFTEAEYQSCDENIASMGASGGSTQIKLKAKELKALEKQRQSLKPALFLSARVHPGETPASWMMKGIMDFLTSDSPAAQQIRKLYVVFIVPILNPDGVVFGNNRCSLSGVDLNRQWKLPVRHLHPTVYYFKMFMLAQKKVREVSMYVDLHVPAGDDSVATGNTGDDLGSLAGGDGTSTRRSSGAATTTANGIAGCGSEDETGAEAAGQNPNIVESDSEDSDTESRAPMSMSSSHGRGDPNLGNQLEIGGSGHNVRHYASNGQGQAGYGHGNSAAMMMTHNHHPAGIAALKSGAAATGHALVMNHQNQFPHYNGSGTSNASPATSSAMAHAAGSMASASQMSHRNKEVTAASLSVTKTGRTDIIPLSGLTSITTSAPNSANSGVHSARSTTALSDTGGAISSSRSNPSPHHFQSTTTHGNRLLSSSLNASNAANNSHMLQTLKANATHGSASASAASSSTSAAAAASAAMGAMNGTGRDFVGMDGEDKGLDRVMELMYASSYRDSAKLRAADGLSSAGSSRVAGKIGASASRGLAASAFELTGNKYHHHGAGGSSNGNVTSAMLGLSGPYPPGSGVSSSAVSTGSNTPVTPLMSTSPRAHSGIDSSMTLAGSTGLGARYQRSLTLDNSGIASV